MKFMVKANGRSNEQHPYSLVTLCRKQSCLRSFSLLYVRTYKIPAIITNCSNNYGPKQHPEKLIPKLIYNIIKIKIYLFMERNKFREWIYVTDHCEALIKIFTKGNRHFL